MVMIRQLHNRYWARVRVPKEREEDHGGRKFLERNLQTTDAKIAKVEASAWEATLRLDWQAKRLANEQVDQPASLRALYAALTTRAKAGAFTAEIPSDAPGEEHLPADAVAAGIEMELDRLAEAIGEREFTPVEGATVAALQDALGTVQGRKVAKRALNELTFTEVAKAFMDQWRTQQHLKDTNTEQQKEATYRLFGGFWADGPLRDVTDADASTFHDMLRTTDPTWGRSASARAMSWRQLQEKFGGRVTGASDATMNRHMAALKALWEWAARRGHCSGHNPFDGFHRKLQQGRNVSGYVAWERDELNKLFKTPPKRADLREVIMVGMFTGMRLDEIASLQWHQIRADDGVTYIQVLDAKTPAGNREVPLHPALGWLKDRTEGKSPNARVWPTFNPEGPGKKAGADAGKEFSRFKAARGFTSRTKAFHSFRKNVTRIMERAGVPENEWAQVFGHEKGFTYGRYNPDGIALERKQAIIDLIAYPGVPLPDVGKPA